MSSHFYWLIGLLIWGIIKYSKKRRKLFFSKTRQFVTILRLKIKVQPPRQLENSNDCLWISPNFFFQTIQLSTKGRSQLTLFGLLIRNLSEKIWTKLWNFIDIQMINFGFLFVVQSTWFDFNFLNWKNLSNNDLSGMICLSEHCLRAVLIESGTYKYGDCYHLTSIKVISIDVTYTKNKSLF